MCYYLLALLTVKSAVDRQGVYLFAQTQQIELDLDAVQSLWLVLGRKILIVYEKKKNQFSSQLLCCFWILTKTIISVDSTLSTVAVFHSGLTNIIHSI